ncbi:MAG: hypothetical protein WC438_01060 [Candidatus Pacearchaeota archaeon]
MATDLEEFEASVQLVWDAYQALEKVDPNNQLLSLIKLTHEGFNPTSEHQKKYVTPRLRCPDGQLCLFDWAYPNQFEARLYGLINFYQDLSHEIKNHLYKPLPNLPIEEKERIMRIYS